MPAKNANLAIATQVWLERGLMIPAKKVVPGHDDLVELVARIEGHDDSALSALYDATVARVYALARRITNDEADSEEVVCDVYTQVWDTAATYSQTRGAVMAWLMMLCRSRALDLVRRRTTRQKGDRRYAQETFVDSLGHWDPVEDVKMNTRLHAALSQLPPERRQIIGLAYFRGFSHEEIAKLASMPLGTVKSHMRRGLYTLREHFAE